MNNVLVVISICGLVGALHGNKRRLLQTERIIETTWNDDYVIGSPGWVTTQPPGVVTVSNDTGTTYHGPYMIQMQFNITQEFYCQKYSSVNIWYKMARCGTENGDRVNLYLNNVLVQSTPGDVTGTPVIDADLNAICTENNPGQQFQQVSYGPFSISEVQMNELFKVHFQFIVTHYNDELVVWDVQIECNPLATTIRSSWTEDARIIPATISSLPAWTVTPTPGKLIIPAPGTGGGENTPFHGPYNGDTNSTSIEQYSISRQFYCNATASVSVTYCMPVCGSTDAEDNVKLYLNDQLQPNSGLTAAQATTGPFNNTDLSSAADGCVNWMYQCIGGSTLNGISLVPFNTLFKVTFELNLNSDTDWLTIAGISITCTTNPTFDPTTYPTNESISTALIIVILLVIICGFIIICAYFCKHTAQKKMMTIVGSKPAIKSVIMLENNKDEIKVEGSLKTLRHVGGNIVREINQSINHTACVVEHDDMDVGETANVIQILMEYTDEGETLHC